MNEIVNKVLLTGNKFVPEFQLGQSRFTYNVCEPFTKHCEKVKRQLL